jgi:hypothetical protein
MATAWCVRHFFTVKPSCREPLQPDCFFFIDCKTIFYLNSHVFFFLNNVVDSNIRFLNEFFVSRMATRYFFFVA